MTVGEKLLDLRKKKGLSQEEVANILNVSRQTISKWETDQTTPDFDKIVPICNLYEISANELLTGSEDIKINETVKDTKVSSAKNIAIAVSLYIISVVFLILFSTVFAMPIIGFCLFLIIIAIATGIIVYNSIVNKKPRKEMTKEEKAVKHICEIISTITVIIYFIISFITMAWYITWVIFLVEALLEEIVKLIFSLKGADICE